MSSLQRPARLSFVQWVTGFVTVGVRRKEREADLSLHLVGLLRMNIATFLLLIQ